MKPLSPTEAFSRAAARCALREYCRADWRRKFCEGGLTQAEAESVLKQLEAGGYIDENRYARAFVHDKVSYDGWGRIKIKLALRQKEIASSDIDEAFSAINDEEYREKLRGLLRRKSASVSAETDYERRQKLVRYAVGRGFEPELIFSLLGGSDT